MNNDRKLVLNEFLLDLALLITENNPSEFHGVISCSKDSVIVRQFPLDKFQF